MQSDNEHCPFGGVSQLNRCGVNNEDLTEEFLVPCRFSRAFNDEYDELRYYPRPEAKAITLGCIENKELKLHGGAYSGFAPEMVMYWLTIAFSEKRLVRVWEMEKGADELLYKENIGGMFESFLSEFED